MRVKSIIINNILSIEHLELHFADSGLVLLDGWNYDDNSGNGAGKTSIWNALSFCLYGKFPRKISLAQILRRKAKTASVIVALDVNGDEIIVERHRPKKEVFTVNGETIPDQEALQERLGLTYEQFLMCMYASQGGSGKFIDLKDSDKKQFFLNLLNLAQFDEVKAGIDERLSKLQADIVNLTGQIETYGVKVSAYKESTEDEYDLLEQLKKYETESLEKVLSKINTSKPDTSHIDDIKSKATDALDDVRSKIADIAVYRSKLLDIDARILSFRESLTSENHIECPNCEKDFVLAGNNSLTIQDYQQKVSDKISSLEAKRLELVDKINCAPSKVRVKELQELISKATRKKEEVLSDCADNRQRFTEIKSKIELRKSKAADILQRIDSNRSIGEKIAKIEDKKTELESKLNKLMKEVGVYGTLSNVFSSTGAQAYVLDNVIDTFNNCISDYVSMIWPNAQYMLLSYKENKSGDIKAKLSDKLIIAGEEVPIGSLSGGELNCLFLSIDLAVVEVLELMSGTKINPYILDEPFKDLDASNRERAVSMLEKASMDRQVWVVDHGSEAKAMFSDIVKIEKRNGVSKLVQES